MSGIPVDRIKALTYVISGTIAGLTGILLASRLSVGNATNGQGDELEVIAAAVIGGISLSGGKGTVGAVLVGSAIIGVIRNAMVLIRVSSFWQEVVIGCVIILAVLLDRLRHRGAVADLIAFEIGSKEGGAKLMFQDRVQGFGSLAVIFSSSWRC